MMNPFDPMLAKKRMEDLTTYKPQHDDESEQPTKQPRFLRRHKKQDTAPDETR